MDCAEEEVLNILLDDNETLSPVSTLKRKASQDLSADAVKLSRQNRKEKKKKSRWKRKKNKKNSESEEYSPQNKMFLRPNYFVGIRVSNPEIHRMVRKVQENALRMEPALHTALVQIPTLHVTLAVAHLPDIDHVNKAAQLVDKCVANYRDFFNTTTSLHFLGLKTFGNEVLFADIERTEVLDQVQLLATDLETCLEELTGTPTKRKFKPHLTVLKISKDFKFRRKGKISINAYSNMVNTDFGSQVVQGVALLSMNKPKNADGYYYSSHQVTFDVTSTESDDHTECCKKPLKPLPNVSQVQNTLQQEKDVVKRRFHSLSLSNLTSMFRSPENGEPAENSTLKKLLIVSAAAVAIIAIVRGFTSSK